METKKKKKYYDQKDCLAQKDFISASGINSPNCILHQQTELIVPIIIIVKGRKIALIAKTLAKSFSTIVTKKITILKNA